MENQIRLKEICKHFVVIFAILFVFLGIPCLFFADFNHLSSADAVTSASVILDAPSGQYIVLLNREKHTETLQVWSDFFHGLEVPIIMEDIVCSVALQDTAGQDMAESFQSRLPENQMKLKREDGLLLLSKAEYGLFDAVVLSQEMAGSMNHWTNFTEVITLDLGDEM